MHNKIMKIIRPSLLLLLALVIMTFIGSADFVHAQVYSGGGIAEGISDAGKTGLLAPSDDADLKTVIGAIVNTALGFVSLLAVAVIVIAGLYLILGLGSDSSRETAKKIVLYVVIGLLVILLAKILVELVKSFVPTS